MPRTLIFSIRGSSYLVWKNKTRPNQHPRKRNLFKKMFDTPTPKHGATITAFLTSYLLARLTMSTRVSDGILKNVWVINLQVSAEKSLLFGQMHSRCGSQSGHAVRDLPVLIRKCFCIVSGSKQRIIRFCMIIFRIP